MATPKNGATTYVHVPKLSWKKVDEMARPSSAFKSFLASVTGIGCLNSGSARDRQNILEYSLLGIEENLAQQLWHRRHDPRITQEDIMCLHQRPSRLERLVLSPKLVQSDDSVDEFDVVRREKILVFSLGVLDEETNGGFGRRRQCRVRQGSTARRSALRNDQDSRATHTRTGFKLFFVGICLVLTINHTCSSFAINCVSEILSFSFA